MRQKMILLFIPIPLYVFAYDHTKIMEQSWTQAEYCLKAITESEDGHFMMLTTCK